MILTSMSCPKSIIVNSTPFKRYGVNHIINVITMVTSMTVVLFCCRRVSLGRL